MGLKDIAIKFLHINDIKYALIGLVEAKLELKKLEIQGQVEKHLSDFIFVLIASLIGLIITIFLSIIVAVGLNSWFGSSWVGFAIIGSLYMLLLLILFWKETYFKDQIRSQVGKSINEKISSRKSEI